MSVQPEYTPNGSDCNAINEDMPLSELAKDATAERKSSNMRNLAVTRRLVIYSFITVFIMLTTSTVLIVVSLDSTPEKTNGTNIIYNKTEWGGKPALNSTKPLHHPTEYVVVSHTAGNFCTNFTTCATELQSIQSSQMEQLNIADIGYNFLIGGDGNVYVGRGWDIRNFHQDNTVDISFMGNYIISTLTSRMVTALKELLDLGLKLHKLAPDYKLVCQNQTHNTSSVGENVFKEVAKFSHYFPGPVAITA